MPNNQQPILNVPHVCILGGGFAGLYTALYLSNSAWARSGRCKITLVEPNDRFLFSPLSYELITGELQAWEIAPSYQKLLANTGVVLCEQKMQKVALKNREVTLEDGTALNYDYLVFAVGAQNRWATISGLRAYALTFRTLADAERLEAKLTILGASERQWLKVIILGGGASGVELACKIADRLGKRAQVHLIERGDEILKPFPSGLRKAAYRAMRARRIQVECGTEVIAVETESITVMRNDQIVELPADLVLWAAGTESREPIARLNAAKNERGQLLTRPTLQLVDHPEVFALGDVAEVRNQHKIVPATAQAAYQQASRAAKNLEALMRGKPLRPFRYLHLGDMLTLGKGAAIVSSFSINLEGQLAAIVRRLVYIQRLPTLRHRWQVLEHLLNSTMAKILRWFNYGTQKQNNRSS
ncbi:FAD-dependent oxidoreductase [Candidatus Gracilibacteria bacterium]|nr:FAD-dependent oxidoreductase [Candidatus Gracilibacteria bacterium]NJM88866.1 FAD-dependent oxidoreductase [Hydrococcus sp. RU_2_2]NJP21737.1 FAD-dependent oxidoreductase [Hydrococcus sp. CRU_1_1]